MQKSKQLADQIAKNPESFLLFKEYSTALYEEGDVERCLAALQRALELYERKPDVREQDSYFYLRKLELQIKREHLQQLVGDAHAIIDPNAQPIFRYGKIYKLSTLIDRSKLGHFISALKSDKLRHLRYLSLRVLESGTDALQVVSKRLPPKLVGMQLHFTDNTTCKHVGAWTKKNAKILAPMRTFHLKMQQIEDDPLIIMRKHLPNLQSFSVQSHVREKFGYKSCYFIADDPNSERLEHLGLVGSTLGENGLMALATSKKLRNLKHLDLRDGVLNNNAARILVAGHYLKALTYIDLRYNEIDEYGITQLEKLKQRVVTDNQHQRL